MCVKVCTCKGTGKQWKICLTPHTWGIHTEHIYMCFTLTFSLISQRENRMRVLVLSGFTCMSFLMSAWIYSAGCVCLYPYSVSTSPCLPIGWYTQPWNFIVLKTLTYSSLITVGLMESATSICKWDLPLFRTVTSGPWNIILTILPLHLGKLSYRKKDTTEFTQKAKDRSSVFFLPARKVRITPQGH